MNRICTNCIGGTPKCNVCDNTGACTTCATNYYVTSGGACACTGGTTNCNACDSSGLCTTCSTHFYPVSGICTTCIGKTTAIPVIILVLYSLRNK